jgi:electron-transferring-flavoprotein dehydrogenase
LRSWRRSLERETLDVDVLIVGGGPAGLSAALRLSQLPKQDGGAPLNVAVLEKSREAGAHMLSGAVLDPSGLRALIPDFVERGAPLAAEVGDERVYLLGERRAFPLPLVPPPLRNHGNYVVSLNRLVKWMAELVEAEGVNLFTGFPGAEVLYEGTRVVGVRTGDRGVDKHGKPKPAFEPGVDVRAPVTIFCDGVRGDLTKTLVARLGLDEGRDPQTYGIGLKELWTVPAGRMSAGSVVHTLGYPLRHEEFGGGFVYALSETLLSVGFVAGLDYKDPNFDPYFAFQRFKVHPTCAALLRGGERIKYGAKAMPEGGWHTVPRSFADGALIAGDAGGFLNSMRLKGIHLAMQTGMLAAEAAYDAVRAGDPSAARLASYGRKLDESAVARELYPVRNVHQAFRAGLVPGLAFAGVAWLTRGWWFKERLAGHAGHERMQTRAAYYGGPPPPPEYASNAVKPDRELTFDRLTSVHFSGTRHDEDQPVHLIVHDTDICRTRCREEYGNPCTRFCPASVYEMVDDGAGGKRLQINASNCVHCKTCDIMDPYQIIDWVTPEGGGGPQYDGM